MTDTFERLGFVSLNRTESGDGYIGALLVTDPNGMPLEFRVTHPVKPTAIQKPLYGESLEPYIGVVLCGRQLVASSEAHPQIVFVTSEFMLDLRKEASIPVVYIRDAGHAIEVVSEGADRRPSGHVKPGGTAFKPLILVGHELDFEAFDHIRGRVETLTSRLDLMEPFTRTAEALKVLTKQDKRFQ